MRDGGASDRSRTCFRCGEAGHLKRDCTATSVPQSGKPKYKGPAGSGSRARGARQSSATCYFCDKPGHVKRDCPARKAWAASQTTESAAAGVGAGAKDAASDLALCAATKVDAAGKLPFVYVDVGASESAKRTRAIAAVDTGATRTLVSREFLNANGFAYHRWQPNDEREMKIYALNGGALQVTGMAHLVLKRQDGPVFLPTVEVQAGVVSSLEVVGSDLLLGADVVATVGGLHLRYEPDGQLRSVQFGGEVAAATASPPAPDQHPSRHVHVTRDGGNVTLAVEDGRLTWDEQSRQWTLQWEWADGQPPAPPVGSGIGEYPRPHLTAEQEALFAKEIDSWIGEGWLVEHDADLHGEPAAVLPLIAQPQEHKKSTPVRPCLDYRALNRTIRSNPGTKAPVCAEKLRKWRVGQSTDFRMIDIRKAYLQVRVHPSLYRYQVVRWRGKQYVMTRMGFGLSVAPKMMSMLVQWVTRQWPDVDSYVDDVLVPSAKEDAVVSELHKYSLPTKPSEPLSSARVLGLQLEEGSTGVQWRRRDGVTLTFQSPLTKRGVFKWTGRLVSHYPVCSWLRPACAFLKRLACAVDSWDEPVPDPVLKCCEALQSMVQKSDPVHGVWGVPCPEDGEWSVHCDASGTAIGAALLVDGQVMEDCCWLRDVDDRKHINIAELDAVIKGLTLAAEWRAAKITLVTDSKTVAGWLRQLVGDLQRVKVSGLHKILVQRRLDVIEDILASTEMKVAVVWVPTDQNLADRLTRVPSKWLALQTEPVEEGDIAAVGMERLSADLVTMDEIIVAQNECPIINTIKETLQQGRQVAVMPYKKIQNQLVVTDGVLKRQVRLPVHGQVCVPVIPQILEARTIVAAHIMSGHAGSNIMYEQLRSRCYFPGMSSKCQDFCRSCQQCAQASVAAGPSVSPTPPEVPSRPWSTIQVDTLELGEDRSGQYHCVLVCVDSFSKWIEVVPLRRHDALSVAQALTSICCRWGPPDEVRMDNGKEFSNAVVQALLQKFGVRVKTGAVRHPQSQGGVERANGTLLRMMRKMLQDASDWRLELELLLYYYRMRPHTTTGVSPMLAMCGWRPRDLVVQTAQPVSTLSEWVTNLGEVAARTRDVVEEELSATCPRQADNDPPYEVSDRVLMKAGNRRQKLTPAFSSGWVVKSIVSPSTVIIQDVSSGREKVVNIDLLKTDPIQTEPSVNETEPVADQPVDADEEPGVWAEFDASAPDSLPMPYNLRDRRTLAGPSKYR